MKIMYKGVEFNINDYEDAMTLKQSLKDSDPIFVLLDVYHRIHYFFKHEDIENSTDAHKASVHYDFKIKNSKSELEHILHLLKDAKSCLIFVKSELAAINNHDPDRFKHMTAWQSCDSMLKRLEDI